MVILARVKISIPHSMWVRKIRPISEQAINQKRWVFVISAIIIYSIRDENLSRTVGKDQVVDEFILTFTHDIEFEYLLPGVPPTGKYFEIP